MLAASTQGPKRFVDESSMASVPPAITIGNRNALRASSIRLIVATREATPPVSGTAASVVRLRWPLRLVSRRRLSCREDFPGACRGLLCGLVIAGLVDEALGAARPEFVDDLGLAQPVGDQVQHGFNPLIPEFLGPFDPAVELFNRRLDRAARERQALATVCIVLHPASLIEQVGQRTVDLGARCSLFDFLKSFTNISPAG